MRKKVNRDGGRAGQVEEKKDRQCVDTVRARVRWTGLDTGAELERRVFWLPASPKLSAAGPQSPPAGYPGTVTYCTSERICCRARQQHM